MDYLLKTEPTVYSFADLQRDKSTVWDGVTNPVAVKNLREMKPGDRLVIYHTGDDKSAVGTATVISVDAADPKNPQVKIKVGERGEACDAGAGEGEPAFCGVSAGEAGKIERGSIERRAIQVSDRRVIWRQSTPSVGGPMRVHPRLLSRVLLTIFVVSSFVWSDGTSP